jgi:hypothetical protein
MSEITSCDSDAVTGDGADAIEQSDTIRGALDKLREVVSAEWNFWGGDHPGHQFEAQFAPNIIDFQLQNLDMTQQLSDTGGMVKDVPRLFKEADDHGQALVMGD